MLKFNFILILLIIGVEAFGQTPPKKLKLKGDFTHKSTSTVLPAYFEGLTLKEVWSFNGSKKNIGANYTGELESQNISIYIYPAGKSGSEARLRTEFQIAEQEIAQINPELNPNKFSHSQYKGDHYIVNAFQRHFESEDGLRSLLSIYECATWFLKIRISGYNERQTLELESNITTLIDPSKLTALRPFIVQTDCHIAPAAFVDEVILGSVISASLAASSFAQDSIPNNEGASGFPDIYLRYHLHRLNNFKPPTKLSEKPREKLTEEYLEQLNSILQAGYVEEFIMEQYEHLLVVPNDLILDFEGFDKWKVQNPISINLKSRFFVNSFDLK